MMNPRRNSVFLIRIWREPSRISPPGEWRGSLRRLDATRERLFTSAEELWRYLTQIEADAQDFDLAKGENE